MLYVKHKKTLKSKQSKLKALAPPPAPAPSVPSPQQPPRSDIDARLDLLTSQVLALTALLNSQLASPQASLDSAPASQAPGPAWLESDARSPHPVLTAGHPQESQALGGSGPAPDEGENILLSQAHISQGPLASAGLGWAPLPSAVPQAPLQPSHASGGVFLPPQSSAAPSFAAASGAAQLPSSSSRHDPRLAPTAAASSGWSSASLRSPAFPSAPRETPRDSESEGSSVSAVQDSASAQLTDLIYHFCPEAKPLSSSTPLPRCGFEEWFDPSPSWTFGQTLLTSAGGLTWAPSLFPASGSRRTLFCRRTPESFWRFGGVSSTSGLICPGPLSQCFATTSQRSLTCARKGALDFRFSTILPRRSSGGRSRSTSGWLLSSFRVSAMSWRTLSPGPTNYPVPSGP